MTGEIAARWLIMSQLAGIEKIVRLGAVVKINTVLIPGINEEHIGDIARVTADACGIPGGKKDFAGELYPEPLETFSHG